MWRCSTCGEVHEECFDSCWKCAGVTPPSRVRPIKPAFSQTGGLRLDNFNASFPFATFSANREALQISCLEKDYIFPKSRIQKLSRYRGFCSVGLHIEHDQCDLPEFVVFWASLFVFTPGFWKLRVRLQALGFSVII
jgi:hypothetical protein